MIHTELLSPLKERQRHGEFLYPAYGELSIAEIVPSILRQFQVPTNRTALPQEYFTAEHQAQQKVVFFMVDGVGFDHFQEYSQQVSFLKTLANKAEVYPLTSVFPSTTPAALTTLHTGFTPQEHGLPEWTVYFEEFDRIIETFPFRPIMTSDREALLGMGGRAEMLYEGRTCYQELTDHGVPSYVFISHEYATSAYSRMTQQGSNVVAFSDFADLFTKLIEMLLREKGKAYYFIYWGHIDSTAHVFGPHSPEHIASLQSFSQYMEDSFLRKLTAEQVKDVLYLQVADHGHVGIEGENIIYLNDYLELEGNYRWGTSKQSIHPTGSPHDVFLHIYQPKVPEVLTYLREKLKGRAEVLTIEDALRRGLFGLNEPSERFKKRIGDLLILPFPGNHVWYKHEPSMQYGQKGIHGGLTESEMIVPLAIAPLAELL